MIRPIRLIPPISIHALRKESDPTTGEQYPPLAYFNPRSP